MDSCISQRTTVEVLLQPPHQFPSELIRDILLGQNYYHEPMLLSIGQDLYSHLSIKSNLMKQLMKIAKVWVDDTHVYAETTDGLRDSPKSSDPLF